LPRCPKALAPLLAVFGALVLAPAAHAAGAPQIQDSWVDGITATGADLHAVIDPGELETRGKAEYISATSFQANLAAGKDGFAGAIGSPVGGAPVGSGATPVQFTRHIGGLSAGAAYRYRITASNSEGTATGPTRTLITQQGGATFSLPDARGWELVSPVEKNGGEIQAPGALFGGGLTQAAAEGFTATYSSASSFASGAGSPGASQYISRRTPTGWATENVTVPTLAGAYGTAPDGVPYRLFSADLARAAVLVPQRCETQPCPRGYRLRQSASGAFFASPEAPDMSFAGANPELTALVLSTCKALTADAAEAPGVGGCDPAQPNLYRWSGGALTLLNLLPAETQGTPGASLAAPLGAVSADGSRVFFSHAGNLYLRSGSATVQLDASLGGGGSFETASADGSIAFFTKEGRLYRFTAAGGALTDLTPAGEVQGVLGASPDGALVYYLTPEGVFGHRNGTATKVAASADASNYPPATGTARVAANGNLAFLSAASLTGADTGSQTQAYLYSPATGQLTCASCNPLGARPLGPSRIPGAAPNGSSPHPYKPRVLSAAGNRLFFDSRDSLALADTNDDWDAYEWEAQGVGSCLSPGGCVALISSGKAEGGASFVDASASGEEAFFLTDGSLVAEDPGAVDLYVARVGGGFPSPPVPIACLGDACQPIPGEPDDPGAGTASYRAEGNPPLVFAKAKKKQKGKGSKKAGKHRKKGKGTMKGKGKNANGKKGGRR
jgi:hypothetical protein